MDLEWCLSCRYCRLLLMEVVWLTLERNTLAYETVLVVALQVGVNVLDVAAATPASLRIKLRCNYRSHLRRFFQ